MANPIRLIGKLQAKTLLPSGEGFGGPEFEKMIIAGALAGLEKPVQRAVLCIWGMDNSVTLDLARDLKFATYEAAPHLSGLRDKTAENLCQWVVQEFKNPHRKLNKDTGMQEIERLPNAHLAVIAGIKKQSFGKSHSEFYDVSISILQSWLNTAYSHMDRELTDEAA